MNQVQDHFREMFSFLADLKIGFICRQFSSCVEKYKKLKFDSKDKKFFPEQPHYVDGTRARILTNDLLFDQYKNKYSGDARFKVKDDILDTIIKIDFTKMRAYNYFIIPTERYKNFLLKNLAEGKSIDITTNSKASAALISAKGYLYGLPDTYDLVSHGINIHQWVGSVKEPEKGDIKHSYLHEKVMLFDDDHGIVGSHNLGAGSTGVSSEIMVEFFSKPIVKTLSGIYDMEKNDSTLTKEATLSFLESEIHDNYNMIRLLHTRFINNIIKELY